MGGLPGGPWITLCELFFMIFLLFRMFFPFNFSQLKLSPSINVQSVTFLWPSSISSEDPFLPLLYFCCALYLDLYFKYSITWVTIIEWLLCSTCGQRLPFLYYLYPTYSPYIKIYLQLCPPQADNQNNPLVVEF